MTILTLEQRTPEWEDYRTTRIGASDAATVVDDHKYTNPYELYEIKKGLKKVYVNEAMKYGIEREPIVHQRLINLGEIGKESPVVESRKEKRFFASLDAATIEKGKVVEFKEIKTTNSERTLREIDAGEVPKYWIWQVQQALFVTELQEAEIVVDNILFPQFATEYRIPVQRNETMINKLIKEGKKFLEYLDTDTPPPSKYEDKSTEQWMEDSQEAQQLVAEIEEREERLAIVRESLINQAHDKSCQGGGIKLLRVPKKGNIDYKSIPELRGVNLEIYRKPSYISWRLLTK